MINLAIFFMNNEQIDVQAYELTLQTYKCNLKLIFFGVNLISLKLLSSANIFVILLATSRTNIN